MINDDMLVHHGLGAIGVGAAAIGVKTKSNKLIKKNQRFIDDIKKV